MISINMQEREKEGWNWNETTGVGCILYFAEMQGVSGPNPKKPVVGRKWGVRSGELRVKR